jgi:acyl transferase domain-containing protein
MSRRIWNTSLSPLKRAYLAIEQLQAKLEALERGRTEPIAIIGIGCRFPGGSDTPEAFWRLLHDGVDAIEEIPPERWSSALLDASVQRQGETVPTRGGFLRSVDGFDPEFFGISPREAISLDPQHRLLLEVCWEALERAGQIPNRLAANQTGVFVGITSHDYAQLQGASGRTDAFDAYHITGNALNAAAGRLSYVFGFQGPTRPARRRWSRCIWPAAVWPPVSVRWHLREASISFCRRLPALR